MTHTSGLSSTRSGGRVGVGMREREVLRGYEFRRVCVLHGRLFRVLLQSAFFRHLGARLLSGGATLPFFLSLKELLFLYRSFFLHLLACEHLFLRSSCPLFFPPSVFELSARSFLFRHLPRTVLRLRFFSFGLFLRVLLEGLVSAGSVL